MSASAACATPPRIGKGVAPVYNAYARVSGDPAFAGRQGDYQALLRPLFMLSFLVDDYLAENEFFGARSVLLSSPPARPRSGWRICCIPAQGHQGDRAHLGLECGIRQIARLLRRGRDL